MAFVYNLISTDLANYPSINGVLYQEEQSLVDTVVYVNGDMSKTYTLTLVGSQYGADLVVNGTFNIDVSGWTDNYGILSWDGLYGGRGELIGDGEDIYQEILEIGKLYQVDILYSQSVIDYNEDCQISIDGFDISNTVTYPKQIRFLGTATSTSFTIISEVEGLNRNYIDSVSVREYISSEYSELDINEYFDVSDIIEAYLNLVVDAFCENGCSSDCSKNTFLSAVLILNGLESARVYHELGDTSNRDAILVKLRALITSLSITTYSGTSVVTTLTTIESSYANDVYKYSLLELYGVDCCNKQFSSLVGNYLIIAALKINNNTQYLAEAYVNCLVSKINKNNCNC